MEDFRYTDIGTYRARTLQDKPQPQHPTLKEDQVAASLYGATTASKKYGKDPMKPSGHELADRAFASIDAAHQAQEDLVASSFEQEKLNARYGDTTPARRPGTPRNGDWTSAEQRKRMTK